MLSFIGAIHIDIMLTLDPGSQFRTWSYCNKLPNDTIKEIILIFKIRNCYSSVLIVTQLYQSLLKSTQRNQKENLKLKTI